MVTKTMFYFTYLVNGSIFTLCDY